MAAAAAADGGGAGGEPAAFSQLPAPPAFYKLYAAGPDAGPPPPAPVAGEIHALGEAFNTDEPFVPPLDVPRLYAVAPDGSIAIKAELLRLNQGLLLLFLELLAVLASQPSAAAAALSQIVVALHNMGHLINLARPLQAEETLKHALRSQIAEKQAALEGLRAEAGDARRRLLELSAQLAAVGGDAADCGAPRRLRRPRRRRAAMPFVTVAGDDLENPAIRKLGQPKHRQFSEGDDAAERRCGCAFLRKGWFWACVLVTIAVCVAAPIGVRTTQRLNAPVTEVPRYKFNTGLNVGLNTSTTGEFNATAGLGAPNQTLTCKMVAADFPTAPLPAGAPPPPLKVSGGKLVTPDGKEAQLHGVNWPGFDRGKTMVDGLDAGAAPSWEGGDFATVVHTLRLLGFNAVRLPFLFTDLLSLPPQDYSKPCPAAAPTAAALAARATAPGDKPDAAPPKFAAPPGSAPARCNAYVPNDGSTLSRFLWVVQFLVGQGFYVVVRPWRRPRACARARRARAARSERQRPPEPAAPPRPAQVDYHPHGTDLELGVVDSVDAYVAAWRRVWMSLTCLPAWQTQLAGRVFADLLNEPDALGLAWGGASGGEGRAPLEAYYLRAMDALNAAAPGQGLFFVQGGGQAKLGTAWGDGFTTDPKWVAERGLADATPFFVNLTAKPYAGQVVLAPHLYGASVTQSPDTGDAQWQKYAASWGHLQSTGFCSANATAAANATGANATAAGCARFPVVAGEVGSSLADPRDEQYYADLAHFMARAPAVGAHDGVPFSSWFWWAYNANSGDAGGLVGDDGRTLDWKKLAWLQDNLGLRPWYAK
ncbi:MED7B [Scenedesmus sp. PABB004]|nr:MED7B [Scenedesmus sp. PABB004]